MVKSLKRSLKDKLSSVISGQLDIYPEMYHWFSSNTLQSDILSSNYSQDGSLWLARNKKCIHSLKYLLFSTTQLSSIFLCIMIKPSLLIYKSLV